MKKIIFLFTAGLYLCLGIQVATSKPTTQPKTDTAEVKRALSKVNKQYGEAFAKADSSLFLNAYTADACLLPAYMPALCGEQAQLAFYRILYKAGIRNVIFTTKNLYGITDQYVTEEGSFETFSAKNLSLGKGKYLVVWKKTSAGWKMYRDMFSSDAPPSKQQR